MQQNAERRRRDTPCQPPELLLARRRCDLQQPHRDYRNGGSLFGKNDGIAEQGIGLTGDPSGQHEIYAVAVGVPQDYIQLDLSSLIAAGFTSFQFQMGSTTCAETWRVSACATAGWHRRTA